MKMSKVACMVLAGFTLLYSNFILAGAENLASIQFTNVKEAQANSSCINGEGDIFTVFNYTLDDKRHSEVTVLKSGSAKIESLQKFENRIISRCYVEDGSLFFSGHRTANDIRFAFVMQFDSSRDYKEIYLEEANIAFVVGGSITEKHLYLAANKVENGKKRCLVLEIERASGKLSVLASNESFKVEGCSLSDVFLVDSKFIGIGTGSEKGSEETTMSISSSDLGSTWNPVEWHKANDLKFPQRMGFHPLNGLYAAFVGEPEAGLYSCTLAKFDLKSLKWLKFRKVESSLPSFLCRNPGVSVDGVFVNGFGTEQGTIVSEVLFSPNLETKFSVIDKYAGPDGKFAGTNYNLVDQEGAMVQTITTRINEVLTFILRKVNP